MKAKNVGYFSDSNSPSVTVVVDGVTSGVIVLNSEGWGYEPCEGIMRNVVKERHFDSYMDCKRVVDAAFKG